MLLLFVSVSGAGYPSEKNRNGAGKVLLILLKLLANPSLKWGAVCQIVRFMRQFWEMWNKFAWNYKYYYQNIFKVWLFAV